jgi:hypothetical protein
MRWRRGMPAVSLRQHMHARAPLCCAACGCDCRLLPRPAPQHRVGALCSVRVGLGALEWLTGWLAGVEVAALVCVFCVQQASMAGGAARIRGAVLAWS